MTARRRFLVRAGAGAAGLGVGAADGALVVDEDDEVRGLATARAEQRFLGAGGAADEGEGVARLGTRRVVRNTTVTEPLAAEDLPVPRWR